MGFNGNHFDNCTNIDECTTGYHQCPEYLTCVDTEWFSVRTSQGFQDKVYSMKENRYKAGSFECQCDDGELHYNGTCVEEALLILKSTSVSTIRELYLVKEGVMSTGLDFNFTDFEIFQSCSVVFNNQMFVFGGKRQGIKE